MALPLGVLAAGYERLLRPAMFASHGGDPEPIHEQMIEMLRFVSDTPAALGALRLAAGSVGRPVEVAGISFPGRVGLAAGLDKDGLAVRAWSGFGFGFAELGTVTALPQPGNDRPRVFRLPTSKALVNRMGFNNHGAAALANSLALAGVARGINAVGIPLGISIGKSKATPLEAAVPDYLTSLEALAPYADYLAVNVSSPNTPGLRTLQDGAALTELVRALVRRASELGQVPVFVKLAPDLGDDAVAEIVGVCEDAGAAGIIATNTTLARDRIAPADQHHAGQAGGLSGAPLTSRALAFVRRLRNLTDLPLMGVGGIMSAQDGMAMLDAGADLIQLYTGFIYAGPALVAQLNAADSRRNR